MRTIDFENLKKGFPAVSKNMGAYLAEAGVFCMIIG